MLRSFKKNYTNITYTYPSRCIKFGENKTKTDNFPHGKAAHFINREICFLRMRKDDFRSVSHTNSSLQLTSMLMFPSFKFDKNGENV